MSISNHPVGQEELMAYLDGELKADRAAEAAEHLAECPECRQLAADLREVSEMVTAWQVEEAERKLPRPIAGKLQDHKQRKPIHSVVRLGGLAIPLRRAVAWGGAAAVVLLLIVAISVPSLLRSGPESQRSAEFARLRQEAKLAPAPPQGEPGDRRAGKGDRYSDGGLNHLKSANKAPAPSGTPATGSYSIDGAVVRDGNGNIDGIESSDQAEAEKPQTASNVPAVNGPMIIRTAELEMTTDAFDKARGGVEEILKRHNGYVGELNVETPAGSARTLSGTLRVPAGQLEATLADLKGLGRTEKETQGGQEVTAQYVDLEARLANGKHTEQRLTEMLRDRTGKLSDVLAVEMEISRVRGQIEQMEAERKTMKNQVDLATITVAVTEAYKAELKAVPASTGTQFRNAAVEGYRSLVDGIISVLLWLLSVGPSLLVWAAILFFPARYGWTKLKPRLAQKESETKL